jgi:hypothetical protein
MDGIPMKLRIKDFFLLQQRNLLCCRVLKSGSSNWENTLDDLSGPELVN